MVGVKAELGAPDPTQPNAGRIEFFVDWYLEHTYIGIKYVCIHRYIH